MEGGIPWWSYLIMGLAFTLIICCAVCDCIRRQSLAKRAGQRAGMPPPMQPSNGGMMIPGGGQSWRLQ